jgi:hypothetical protein
MNNRQRMIGVNNRFENLTDKEVPARLTKALTSLAQTVTEIQQIADPPPAVNLQASAVTGAILLTWDDVPRETVPSIDGTRIWRALASADPNMNFSANNAKWVLVSVIRSTAWLDVPGDTNSYIYWIQHINKDGKDGSPSAGVTKAAL